MMILLLLRLNQENLAGGFGSGEVVVFGFVRILAGKRLAERSADGDVRGESGLLFLLGRIRNRRETVRVVIWG